MYIVVDIEERKKYWEEQHDKKDIYTLSGCSFKETVDFLKIREYINPSIRALEVGVGLGYVTEVFSKICSISALDISGIALSRVISYCENVYMINNLSRLQKDYFDLIFCHNLIQHIPTELLKVELSYLIQSLVIDGIFALEFISAGCVPDTGNMRSSSGVGLYCRTPRFLEKLINGLGGVCELVVDNNCDIDGITGCHVFHVRKSK